MVKQPLLRSQKNEILELIKQNGLDPYNFKWSYVPSTMSAELKVESLIYISNADFFFKFDIHTEKHYAIYSPGTEMPVEKHYPGDWATQKRYVIHWLKCLKREINQPDLWADVSKYALSLKSEIGPDVSNDPFSVPQAEQILLGLNQVRDYIGKQKLATEEQSEIVTARLDYLAEAIKRQGRKDWFHTCLGVFVTLSVALALSPEQAKAIWNLMKDAIVGVIQLLPS